MATVNLPQPQLVTDRNRINQRNFRARRQSYIRELEQRVRKLESDGISATKEVQIAAQQVDCENRLLKRLLEIQFGVSRYQIDKYLQETPCHLDACTPRSSQQTNVEHILPDLNARLPSLESIIETEDVVAATCGYSTIAARLAHTREENASEAGMLPQRSTESPSGSVVSTIESGHFEPHPHLLHPGSTDAPGNQTCKGNTAYDSRPGAQLSNPSSPLSAALLLPRHYAVSDELSGGGAGLCVGETLCEEAANILVKLRGQDNYDEVWRELGCGERQSCRVMNLSIFELMDIERS
ncbi:hypothetical protein HRR83_003036 [Exophiala dermatitidis]|uniref:BZIP domain-containing protein n=1 Tax=Exophiala dermatitidis TaxID=5970 RepID=A0AAN6IRK8_EXODE|nr:hypothetical protein HRR73_007955 [Exophiala dermatitidis]KAJ4520533.1 hypothetical protein HRR74_003531 [Exophiala dermatitidis]KAJ4537832.1 hypothetical protein HRR76_005814 [Exophiala dermatitidis]KAJ4551504.1 hypothetical protein HRR77_002744 [Exophiala dermatitidis]KAJ4569237.1 hypothetical protein HRR79_004098 [Exophiala dermatitidis]